MTLSDPYCTVAEFKARVGEAVNAQDELLTQVLLAASRQIDNFCARSFGQGGSVDAPESRYFTWQSWRGGAVLGVDDLISVAAISTDDGSRSWATEVASDAYELSPLDAVQRGEPYTQITLLADAWPRGDGYVRISGVWGWPSVPDPIREACQMLANRQKSLWKAPFGQTGAGEMGAGLDMTAALTPLIKEMLAPYRVLAL